MSEQGIDSRYHRYIRVDMVATIFFYSIDIFKQISFFIIYSIIKMTTTNKAEFATKSVAVIDDAIVITFISDGVEKKKTMPFTDK